MIKEIKVKTALSPSQLPGLDYALNPYRGCAHACDYCLDGETLILKADMTAIPIKELNIGDILIGFVKEDGAGHPLWPDGLFRFAESIVLSKSQSKKQVYEIELQNGMKAKCSKDHRWLSTRGYKYVTGSETGQDRRPFLTINNNIRILSPLMLSLHITEDYMKGYLSGIIRGDAHIGTHTYEREVFRKDRQNNPYHRKDTQHQFLLRLKDISGIERTKQFLNKLGIQVFDFIFTETMSGIRTSKQESIEQIKNIIEWSESIEYRRGFLAGLYDAEGSFDGNTVRFSNSDPVIIQYLDKSLKSFGFLCIRDKPKQTKNQILETVRLSGGMEQYVKFWQLVIPAIKRKTNIIGKITKNSTKIKSIKKLDYEDTLYDIKTSTENFVANGMISHNCYAPSVIHWDKGKWGELVEVKVNLPHILSKELRVKKKGVVGLGTVTDPYQPAENKYEMTRRCLELLLMHDFPVCIQTKSSLVLRDINLLKEFTNVEVGITLTALDDAVREKMEPGASSVNERLRALAGLRENGIKTWVFLGPVMPHITEVEALVDAIAEVNPEYVLVDRLRVKDGVWENVRGFIQEFRPELINEYERIFRGDREYYGEFFEKIISRFEKKGLRCEINRLGD